MITQRNEPTRTELALDTLFDLLSNRRVMILLTVAPVLILYTVVILLPVLWNIAASFFSVGALSPEWTWVGIENYRSLLSATETRNAFVRGVVFMTGSVLVQVVVGTGLALLINRPFKYASFVRAVVLLPYLIPTAVVGFLAMWMGNSQWGVISQILMDLGLVSSPVPWFGKPSLAMPALILTTSWKFSIFVTLMVLARLQGIPNRLYESAEMAGANAYHKFRDVTLPYLKNVLFIVVLLRGVWMFNKFDIIWVLTRGGPADATQTPPVFAYQLAFIRSQIGKSAALATLLFIILGVFALVYFYFFNPSKEVRVE